MMNKAFLVKYAEIGIKGKNRHLFEKALCVQMEHALAPVDGNFQVTREMGRIYVNTEGDFDYEGAVDTGAGSSATTSMSSPPSRAACQSGPAAKAVFAPKTRAV